MVICFINQYEKASRVSEWYISINRNSPGPVKETHDQLIEGGLGLNFNDESSLNFANFSLESFSKSRWATFHFIAIKSCNCTLPIPFFPGLIRIYDALLHFAYNLISLIWVDCILGAKDLLSSCVTRLTNVPKRITLLVRNIFHLIAGVAQMIPFSGGLIAHLVYLVNIYLENIVKLITCTNSNNQEIHDFRTQPITYCQKWVDG